MHRCVRHSVRPNSLLRLRRVQRLHRNLAVVATTEPATAKPITATATVTAAAKPVASTVAASSEPIAASS